MKILRSSIIVLLALPCITIQHACTNEKPAVAQPNIVWIVCEDISPFLGVYGQENISTPNLDRLASEGVRYTNAFTTAGVCAPSRATIITGMYQMSIGTQHMRTLNGPDALKYSNQLNYSAVIPDYVKCFPEYLRMAGYYCTNNEKQDYQFRAPVTVWDENGPGASWRNRPDDRPFFSVFNFAITHESQIFMRDQDSLLVRPADMQVPPYYPDTKTVRHDVARLFTNIEKMDAQVGQLLQLLKEDGLYDQTIIFFYSDHGGALPWMKRELLNRGTHIPLIIRFPGMKDAGTVDDQLISSVDFAPTVLSLAGVEIPSHMQGQAFLGLQKADSARRYVYAARDRMDTEYDRVRAVRDRRYQYLYNYMPEKPYYQDIQYRLGIAMMREIIQLKGEGKLGPETLKWFDTKPVEELYDLEKDPNQLHNLATNPEYREKVEELRAAFENWTRSVGDMSEVPEKEMIAHWWHDGETPPVTATPAIKAEGDGVTITCATRGASIGYRIIHAGMQRDLKVHKVMSWDFRAMNNPELKDVPAPPVWEVYKGEPIHINAGDSLKVEAMRIGYEPASIAYVGK